MFFVKVSDEMLVNCEKVQCVKCDGCRVRFSFGGGSHVELTYIDEETAKLAIVALNNELNGIKEEN